MQFSLLKKGSMVFLLSFLVMSFSLVSFGSVAFAGEHYQEHKCKPSAKAIETTETAAGFGGFVMHARCLPASTAFVVTSNLPPGCPSPITPGPTPAVTISGFGGHIDAFVAFGPSLNCIPGNYIIVLVGQYPGLVVTIPLEIKCCSSTGANPN